MPRLSPWLGVALALVAWVGCRKAEVPAPPVKTPRALDAAEVARLFPEGVGDADGWARELLRAFAAAAIPWLGLPVRKTIASSNSWGTRVRASS